MSTLLTKFDPMDSLFREFFHGTSRPVEESKSLTLRPRVDIHENDAEYRVTMDLPGVTKDDVNVSVENGTLTISASRREESSEEFDAIRRERYVASSYSRSFSLSDQVNTDGIKGKLNDGVLTLTIPKAEQAQPRKIRVE